MSRRKTRWGLPLLLMVLTFLSTFYVGAGMVIQKPPTSIGELAAGWVFSLPLMAILMAHEFGHFFAGMYHRVDVSPPYFIPVPFFLFGTMGAVIQIRERIRSRNALLDIGAAGPLCGMAIALPVIIYGIDTSPIQQLPDGPFIVEGRSILYLGLLSWLKGPIPQGYDIMLTPTALAGWAGLLVTMINLIPFGQLDGGHVAYALLGSRQNRISGWVLRALPVLAIIASEARSWCTTPPLGCTGWSGPSSCGCSPAPPAPVTRLPRIRSYHPGAGRLDGSPWSCSSCCSCRHGSGCSRKFHRKSGIS